MTPLGRLIVADLGRQSYRDTLTLQRRLREARLDGALADDVLLLVEHDPVYTLGRGTRATSLPESETMLRARGADVIEIERGGDVTWHGPGQLVGYPIIDLTRHRADLHWYLRALEDVLITALAEFGLAGSTVQGKTGVWIGPRKIASLGIHVRRWVTLHGLALNVQPDLEWFTAIVPCGLAGVEMTSIARELGGVQSADALMKRARSALVLSMSARFDLVPVRGDLQRWAHPSPDDSETCDSAPARPPFMQYG